MTGSRRHHRVVRGAGALAAAGALLLGSACGGGDNEATEGNAPGAANGPTAVIPMTGGQPTGPAPEFTTRAPAVPEGGVSLEELHSQGKTEVVR